MTYTDHGTRLGDGDDWLPLAAANGLEWAHRRQGEPDRWQNLYIRRWGVRGLLWYAGAAAAALGYRPRWLG